MIRTFIIILAFTFTPAILFSQQSQQQVSNIGANSITIDGDASDEAWLSVVPVSIDLPYSNEQPTTNSATWKMLWSTNGIYIVVEVSDDVWMPSWVSGLNSWESDKIEVYIDMTDPQKDGGGASGGNGNYQVGPDFSQDQGVEISFDALGTVYASTFDGAGAYVMEYYVPFAAIPDNNGVVIDPTVTATIGFDVTVIDLDEVSAGRDRAVWANTGAIDESWNNMDDVGLLTFVNSSTDLIANFVASKTTTGPNKDIQFTDYSNGTPTEWLWDFGDGVSSTEQNPTHAYTNLGNYTVSLTVNDVDDSTSTQTKTDYISITSAALEPTAAFSASKVSAQTDERIDFTDESLYAPTSWLWYFGDGSISTEQSPSHHYTSPGTYTVILIASNANGSHTLRKSDYITVTQGLAPVADFSANTTSIKQNESVQFTDQSSNHATYWKWKFGDGTESFEQNPVHTYTRGGSYTVSLKVENSSGDQKITKIDFVQVESVEAPTNIEVSEQNIARAYPNPSTGVFNVDVSVFNGESVTVKVFNLIGKPVYSVETATHEPLQINISNHPVGVYYMQVQSGEQIQVQKLLVE